MSMNAMLTAGTSVHASVDTPVFHSFIADGILAAHLRRRARQDQQTVDDIPIVYNLLDYLLLALPGGADVLIATDDQKTAPLSTAIGGPCLDVDVATIKANGVRFSATDSLWLAPSNLSDTHQKEVLASVATWVSQLAATRGPDVAMELSRRLSRGLTQLVHHLTAHPFVPPVPASEVVLDDIIQHTLDNFDRVLKNADETYSFVIRYWTKAGPRLIDLKRKTEPPPDSGIAKQVRKVLDTGVARWALAACDTQGDKAQVQPQAKMTIGIPGHFGGVPWLVTYRAIPIADGTERWWAYSAYRDYSTTHTLLRATAISSLASEMRRLLLSALGGPSHPDALSSAAEAEWRRLMRVYPIPKPSLRESTPSLDQSHRLLPIGGHHYDVAFSDEANTFFTWPTLPTASDSEGYGPFSAADAQTHFITPVQNELHMLQARRNEDLSRGVYAVGHPLKHRLGLVNGSLDALGESLLEEHIQHARIHRSRTLTAVAFATHTAEMMDFWTSLCQHQGDVARVDPKFLSTVPYQFGSRLRAGLQEFEHARWQLSASEEELCAMDAIQVAPLPSVGARPFDTFYDDLIFEVLFNAYVKSPRAGRTVSVGVQQIGPLDGSAPTAQLCIVFSNRTRASSEHDFTGLGLALNKWTRWRDDCDGPKGGLQLHAFQLRTTRTGDLFVRPYQHEGAWWWSTGIYLESMTGAASKASHIHTG